LISQLSSTERQSLFGKLPDAIRDLPHDELTRELRPHLLATLAEVSIAVWHLELARRYEGIRQILESWCTDAHHHVMSRIATSDSSPNHVPTA
jgi:hypothetical protein